MFWGRHIVFDRANARIGFAVQVRVLSSRVVIVCSSGKSANVRIVVPGVIGHVHDRECARVLLPHHITHHSLTRLQGTCTTESAQGSSSALTAGDKAGIAIGVIAFIVILFVVGYCYQVRVSHIGRSQNVPISLRVRANPLLNVYGEISIKLGMCGEF